MSLWNLAIPAALGIGSALIGSSASKSAAKTAGAASDRAADTSLQATQEALAFQREGRDLARGDLAPYQGAGLQDYASYRAAVNPNSFTESPGYQFARGEGIRAIDQGASARGLLNSGARLRELTRYGTGVANQEYGNYMSRLQGLAGVGQTATGQAASLASGAGQTAAGIAQQGGAQQAGYINQGGQMAAAGTVNATNAGLQGLAQGVNLYALMNQPQWGGVRP